MDDALKRALQDRAQKLGFAQCRVTTAEPVSVEQLRTWLGDEKHGTMQWIARDPHKRSDPSSLLPGAKSVICCALSYDEHGLSRESSQGVASVPVKGLSRLYRGEDYHEVVREKLDALADELKRQCPEARTKCCVDTSPLLEKALGARAGVGWIGKNTLLISPDLGSWFVLGEIITNIELSPDAPIEDRCGTCRSCLEACPTNALNERSLDARRCISYLTIERRGEVVPNLARYIPRDAYGCDLCQEACPYNTNR